MKTLFVFSDTHGNLSAIKKLEGIMEESDYVIHLGDFYSDARGLSEKVYEKLYRVKGNCDGGGDDVILEVEDVKILLTHGDRYGVKTTLNKLCAHAQEVGANLVLFGHTHIPEIVERDNIMLVNPGSMSTYGENSYCYIVINKDKITAKTVLI